MNSDKICLKVSVLFDMNTDKKCVALFCINSLRESELFRMSSISISKITFTLSYFISNTYFFNADEHLAVPFVQVAGGGFHMGHINSFFLH